MATATANPPPPDYDPFKYSTQDDPYPIYRVLLDHFPVYRNEIRDFWAISRYADVQACLRDRVTFSNAAGVNLEDFTGAIPSVGNFLDMDPPRHDLLRRILHETRLFTPQGVGRLETQVRQQASDLIASFKKTGRADLATEFAHRLSVAVISELMGLPQEDGSMLKRWADLIMGRAPDDDRIPAAGLAAAAELQSYLQEISRRRRGSTKTDLVTAVANATPNGGPLSPDEIVGMLFLLFTAGTTTTGDFISNSILVLWRHSDQRALLATNLGLMPSAVEELLRFESPVQYTSRTTTRQVRIHGMVLPPRARVVLLFGAAHRDSAVFDEPDRLDLGRTPKRLLAFGDGIHHCLGAPLARLEANAAFQLLLQAMPRYDVLPGWERFHDSHQRGLAHLPTGF